MRPLARPLRSLVALGSSLRRSGMGTTAGERAADDVACRNCGAEAPGAFCPACGQETSLALPNAGRFMREAAGRYVAFDGRMWRTLFALLFRPGFLTREYFAGRRRRYVRPARLVLVLAIVLFAVVRVFADPDEIVRSGITEPSPPPTAAKAAPDRAPPNGKAADATPPAPAKRAVIEMDHEPLTLGGNVAGVRIDEALNVQLTGPRTPLREHLDRRLESFNHLDRGQKLREILAGMLRYGPYALIALLPLFALLMQVLHAGRSRRYPGRPRRYAEHLVYAAHTHAFIALVVTLVVAIPWPAAAPLLGLWSAVYLLVSLRVVYGGRWIGAFARGVVATLVYAAMFVVAVIGLFFAAIVLR